MHTLKAATRTLKKSTSHSISVSAGCDLFLRFVTVTSHDLTEFQTCKDHLLQTGNFVVEKASTQKLKIVGLGEAFVRDGAVILTHSYSRVVMMVLAAAAKQNKRFKVFVTESRPSCSGYKVAQQLKEQGIPCTVILDSAVAYIMGKVDMVLVGAEGVVENGGLINSVGTYQLAICAKHARKPFYAAAESFKFVRMYPLNQYDVPYQSPSALLFVQNPSAGVKSKNDTNAKVSVVKDCNEEAVMCDSPTVDYTPPQFITLLFTDLGVLTPSGVSDELIKIYY